MSKKAPQKDPPAKFTESYQFIQTMFQEPMSWQERLSNLLSLIKRGLFVFGSLAIVISLVFVVIYFDVLSTTLSDTGLHIPKRWP
ncbi:hypothetical protein [Reinekea sp.]|jgi:hypothetical protein|uniref:hypothetical protein n=1 Tax=Reinekea sp. TaxID=1970455 RepID=UPI00398A2A31